MPDPATEASTLLALLERIERAARATGLTPEELHLVSKVNASGETHVGLTMVARV